jgi:G3E family GTPase
VGCSLANSLVDQIKKIKRRHEPDVLFVEPSEMVVSAEMRHVCAMGRRDTAYEAGPLITLVDGPRFDFLWAERSQLIMGQVRGADIVAVGRSDLVEVGTEAMIRQCLNGVFNEIILVSSVNGTGLDHLMAMMNGC